MTIIPDTPDPIKTFECTDAGNADRFAVRYGHQFKFCIDEQCWYGWSGKRWKKVANEQMFSFATKVARAIETEPYDSARVGSDLQEWCKKSQFRERLTAMVELAKGKLAVVSDKFDSDSFLVNCSNGTIDLRTGSVRQHNPDDLITKLINTEYNPESQCPMFMKFLDEAFAPHPELIPFVQRAFGYSLTGSVREECLFLLVGTHRNGKGTLTGILSHIIGDYGCTIDFSSLVAKKNYTGPKDDVANMKDKRFVTAHENAEGARLAEDLIKWLTGGDLVRARKLYSNSVEIKPTWKLWLSVNHRPIVSPTDPAIWTRLMVIPFDVSFEGREDRTLKDRLLTELPGVFAWAVQGCLKYQSEGLNPPECVLVTKEEYRKGMNQLSDFVEEECILDQGLTVLSGELYGRYLEYCTANGSRYPVGHKKFAALLAVMGVRRGRAKTAKGDRTFVGICLREDGSDTSDTSEQESPPGKGKRKKVSRKNVSERQIPPKPLLFKEIDPCPACGSDEFWCQIPGGELQCCRCKPFGRLEDVAEWVSRAVELELDLDGFEGGTE